MTAAVLYGNLQSLQDVRRVNKGAEVQFGGGARTQESRIAVMNWHIISKAT